MFVNPNVCPSTSLKTKTTTVFIKFIKEILCVITNKYLIEKKVLIIKYIFSSVVHQSYEVEADNEYVIRGNSVIMKCEIPSFVADFVSVAHWVDSSGKEYYTNQDYGTY